MAHLPPPWNSAAIDVIAGWTNPQQSCGAPGEKYSGYVTGERIYFIKHPLGAAPPTNRMAFSTAGRYIVGGVYIGLGVAAALTGSKTR